MSDQSINMVKYSPYSISTNQDILTIYIYIFHQEQLKCGYCGWCLKRNQIIERSCFANAETDLIFIDKESNIFIAGIININILLVNYRSFIVDLLLINIIIAEKETVDDTGCNKGQLNENLIAAVKSRPALYDFRLPVKERGRKQKDDLSREISIFERYNLYRFTYTLCYVQTHITNYKLYIIGLYTPTEAEKRWNYLKDCYRKARNLLKKQQNVAQGSGAAGASKTESIKPSFRYYNVMSFLNDTLEHRQ